MTFIVPSAASPLIPTSLCSSCKTDPVLQADSKWPSRRRLCIACFADTFGLDEDEIAERE